MEVNPGDAYSWPDRLLHRIAFSALTAQRAVSDIEDRVFSDRLESIDPARPVFITSLPRAGTTLLLEILARQSEFNSHCYRNLPFVLCPLFWEAFSRHWRKPASVRERAHGDRMTIGFDSPEGLEEIIWKAFWPARYSRDRIVPWSTLDRDREFEEFLRNHMRKIVSLGPCRDGQVPRYVSKNNANIARMDLLETLFPNCVTVVPIRQPWAHIGSMYAQHRRFSTIHDADAFSLSYMRWLGHHEFGAALIPLDLGGWIDSVGSLTPDDTEFWARYWLAFAQTVTDTRAHNVFLFDYDRACAEPQTMLGALARAVGVNGDALLESASRFRSPTRYVREDLGIDEELSDAIEDAYARLCDRARASAGDA